MMTREWEDSVKKKIRYMANSVWDGVSMTDIDEFMSNFKEKDKAVGWALLDMLIYYSSEQEESIISNLMRLLKRELWLRMGMAQNNLSSSEINSKLHDAYKEMCFVPIDESDPSASSYSLTAKFKKSKEVPSTIEYIDIADLPLMMAMNYKYFVFYDDLIGTGNQFDEFWKKNIFGKNKKIKLRDLAEKNSGVIFYYLAFGGCQEGVEKLKKNISNVGIIVSEYFPKNIDLFDEKNEYWELNPDKRDMVCNFVREKEHELGSRSRFSKNLPVLFQHGRASNTALSLYWYNKENDWKGLYKR